MYRLKNIKRNILIVSFATLLVGCGGGGTTTSTDSTTSTDATLKVVTVQTNEPIITETSATINWIPNGNTTKLVEYGTSKKYGSEVLVQEEGTITLDNLQANTLYHYRIVSEDKNGRLVVSRDKTFTTLEESTQPIVTEPVPTEPIVTEPIVTEPIVTEPVPTEPIVTEPIVTEPIVTEPIVTEPVPTEPIVTDPVPTEPIVTDPVPTEPIVTEPVVTTLCVEGDATIEGQMISASASAEEAVNGDFNTDTVWDKNIGWTISNGTANVDSTGLSNEWLTQPGILTIGKTYTLTFTVSNYTSGSIGTDSWYPVYADSGWVSSNGVHTIDFTAAKTNFQLMAKGDTILSIDNVSVKESSGAAAGIANVEVTYGACTTLTDTEGYYRLPNVITSEKAVINFTHQGYVSNSIITQVKSDSTNYIEYEIGTYDHQEIYDSQNSIILNMANNAAVSLPAAIYSDETGNIYNGGVIAKVAYLDVTTEKGREAFPGTYNGQNTNGENVLFTSYGVVVVDINDGNDNNLVLSEGKEAILTFPAIASSEEKNIIPLWYYDYAQGIWIEEGYATRLVNGQYEGTVSHPGTWSLSQPIETDPGIYTDRILYPDGTPVTNLRVHAVGENWISADLSTDENGVFEIEVIPGATFTLKAYHTVDKYSATYNGMISAVISGEIVNNSKL